MDQHHLLLSLELAAFGVSKPSSKELKELVKFSQGMQAATSPIPPTKIFALVKQGSHKSSK